MRGLYHIPAASERPFGFVWPTLGVTKLANGFGRSDIQQRPSVSALVRTWVSRIPTGHPSGRREILLVPTRLQPAIG